MSHSPFNLNNDTLNSPASILSNPTFPLWSVARASPPFTMCYEWSNPNHVLFQLANTFLLLSYVAPTGIYGLLYLRCCLTLGSVFFACWGWLVLCSLDTLVWNILFTAINAIFVCIIIYQLHPFIRFPHDVELVYRDLFHPLHVSRHSFRKIYKCTSEIQTLKPKEFYCIEGKTPVDKLSLLLSGRVAVIRNNKTIHMIDSHQFLDSPEWFGVGSNENFQVTIMALEESRLLVWHRDKLKLSISDDAYMQAVLDNILGKDVVKKLLFVTDSVSNTKFISNVQSNSSISEQSKLIVPVQRGMDQIVKRNVNFNSGNAIPCFWSLSKISEDAETNV